MVRIQTLADAPEFDWERQSEDLEEFRAGMEDEYSEHVFLYYELIYDGCPNDYRPNS